MAKPPGSRGESARSVADSLLRIARDATRGSSFQERMHALSDTLVALIPATSVHAAVLDLEETATIQDGLVYARGGDGSLVRDYARFARLDPRRPEQLRATGRSVLLSDFVPHGRFGACAFTADFLGPHKMRYSLACIHRMPNGRSFGFGLQRERALGDFDARDRELFDLVAPDLARAAAASILSVELARCLARSEATPAGTIVFDAAGRLHDMDVGARALLESGDGRDLLASLEPLVRRHLAVAGATGAAATEDLAVGLRRYLVKVVTPRRGGIGALVKVTDVSRGAEPAGADSGLTDREAEVARLAARGFDNKGMARVLGISVDTVKFHMKKIYAKTGARSRVDLALTFTPPP